MNWIWTQILWLNLVYLSLVVSFVSGDVMADCNLGIYRIAVEDEQVACGFERATGMMLEAYWP